MTPRGAQRVDRSAPQLTPVEWKVAASLVAGLSDVQMADFLNTDKEAIRRHIAALRKKLNVRSRADIARWRQAVVESNWGDSPSVRRPGKSRSPETSRPRRAPTGAPRARLDHDRKDGFD